MPWVQGCWNGSNLLWFVATPERIAQIAEDEDVDAVALSLLNGAH